MNSNTVRINVLCLLATVLLSGCATLQSSKEELQGMNEEEGIIIGSVLLSVQPGEAQESGWAWLKGRKAAEQDYALNARETGLNPFSSTYAIQIKAGEENIFVKKLQAGSYRFIDVTKTGFGPLKVDVGIGFTVTPGQATYIGKLVIIMPDRIGIGTKVTFSIQDEQEKIVKHVSTEYQGLIPTLTKGLMIACRVPVSIWPGIFCQEG